VILVYAIKSDLYATLTAHLDNQRYRDREELKDEKKLAFLMKRSLFF
jgi:hypothetical protein